MNIQDKNLTLQLPPNIIINILKMRPRDSQTKSTTSDLFRKEFDNVYLAQCDHEYQHYDKYPSKD
jgi:hypothetical protein